MSESGKSALLSKIEVLGSFCEVQEDITSSKETEKSYKCTHEGCEKTFSSRLSLQNHRVTKHSDGKPPRYPCKVCAKTFSYPSSLSKHTRFAHEKQVLKCSEKGCELTFPSYDARTAHVLSEHGQMETKKYPRDSFNCDHEGCGVSFATHKALKVHIRMKHSKTKPSRHPCTICEKAYLYSWDLNRHMRNDHDITGPYQCEYQGCQKNYKTHGQLKCHIKMKHMKSNHSCTMCEMSYGSKSHLEKHIWMVHVKNSDKDSGNYSKDKRVSASVTMGKENRKYLQRRSPRQRSDNLIHVEFPKQNISLGDLKRKFYAQTLQACQEAGYDGDSSPNFKDITLLHGKLILRLENSDHLGFFTKIVESMGV